MGKSEERHKQKEIVLQTILKKSGYNISKDKIHEALKMLFK